VIANCVEARGGTLLEFIADEVVALFNSPEPLADHAQQALHTACAIQENVDHIATTDIDKKISLRCGITTAKVLVGNIGSRNRMKYGALGDGVNLAARLKGLNSRYRTKCLASEAVIAHAASTQAERPQGGNEEEDDSIIARPVDLVVVKGKTLPIRVYDVLGPRWHHESLQDIGEVAERHRVGFDHYLNRRFSEAIEELREVNSVLEASTGDVDEPSRMLMERCLAYALDPPAADWDGAERLLQKSWAPPARERGDTTWELKSKDLRSASMGENPPQEMEVEEPHAMSSVDLADLPNSCSQETTTTIS